MAAEGTEQLQTCRIVAATTASAVAVAGAYPASAAIAAAGLVVVALKYW